MIQSTVRTWAAGVLDCVGAIRATSTTPTDAAAVVFAPHPDDEVLGCGGTIALKIVRGARVDVVYMTDGAASHRGLIDPAELVALRRGEAVSALNRLGVPESAGHFLMFPDGELAHAREQAFSRIVALISDVKPREVFVPHRLDRLDDHVATNRIVFRALQEVRYVGDVYEYPIWLWHCWPWTTGGDLHRGLRSVVKTARDVWSLVIGCAVRVDIGDVMERKRAALAEYRSQVERRPNAPTWPILADVSDGAFLARLTSRYEVMKRTRWSGRRA